jgi:hypothetical protein
VVNVEMGDRSRQCCDYKTLGRQKAVPGEDSHGRTGAGGTQGYLSPVADEGMVFDQVVITDI